LNTSRISNDKFLFF
jgi:hypothetical protein